MSPDPYPDRVDHHHETVVETAVAHHYYDKASDPTHAENIRLHALNIVNCGGLWEKDKDPAALVERAAVIERYILSGMQKAPVNPLIHGPQDHLDVKP